MARHKRLLFPKADEPEVVATILGWIGDAALTLDKPLTEEMIRAGWTDEKRASMLRLLGEWHGDIALEQRLRPGDFKVIVRWFLDWDVDTVGVGEDIVDIDNQIHRATEEERASRKRLNKSSVSNDPPRPVLWRRRQD